MASLVEGNHALELVGQSIMWRWRFLVSPPTSVDRGSRVPCVVALTDEFGSEISPRVAAEVLGPRINVRCELCPSDIDSALASLDVLTHGQRSTVTAADPSKPATCRWNFCPRLPPGKSVETWSIRVCGERSDGQPFDPLLVFPVMSAPISVVTTEGTGDPTCIPLLRASRSFAFSAPSGGSDSFAVTIHEEFGANLGAHVWNSGLVLAQYLVRERARFMPRAGQGSRTRVLELGSGCGVAGIVAARALEASVMLTDLAPALPLLRHNLAVNVSSSSGCLSVDLHPEVLVLDWNDYSAEVHDALAAGPSPAKSKVSTRDSLGRFDLVIAADVLYGPHLFLPLLALLRTHATGLVIIALSHRNFGPAPLESKLRGANSPSCHPFFSLAAAEGWTSESACFAANIEVIEMTRS